MVDGALASGDGHGLAHFGVGHEEVDGLGEVFGELFGVEGFEGAFGLLLDVDEEAGDVVDDDLFDATDGAGDDGGFAGHGFEVDDAEGFVDGRAAEDVGVRVEGDFFLGGDHFIDPDDTGSDSLSGGDGGVHFGGDFGGVGGAGAEDDLEAGVEVLDGADEVDDAFLTGDATDEEDIGLRGIDAVFFEKVGAVDLVVFVGVDAVVDDVDAVGVDVEEAEDVGLGFFRDGDDGV